MILAKFSEQSDIELSHIQTDLQGYPEDLKFAGIENSSAFFNYLHPR